MVTVNELFYDCIRFDEEKLAYSIYYLLKNGIKQGNENSNNIDWSLVDVSEVKRMIAANELNLKIIKLYTVPLEDNQFMIIFAESEESARGYFMNEMGELPKKIIEMPQTKMETSFWLEDKRQFISLRKLREDKVVFPCTALIFKKTGV